MERRMGLRKMKKKIIIFLDLILIKLIVTGNALVVPSHGWNSHSQGEFVISPFDQIQIFKLNSIQ